VIAVGDHDLAAQLVPYQQQRRELLAVLDLLPVFFDVVVADAEQAQARRTEISFALNEDNGARRSFCTSEFATGRS
jgi:hypothetical protein